MSTLVKKILTFQMVEKNYLENGTILFQHICLLPLSSRRVGGDLLIREKHRYISQRKHLAVHGTLTNEKGLSMIYIHFIMPFTMLHFFQHLGINK